MQINPDTNHSRQTALTFFRTLKKPVCVEISSDREGKLEKDSERIPDNSRKSQSGRGGHISVMSAMNQVLAFVLFEAIAISFPVAGWPSEKLRIQEVRNVDAGPEKAGASGIKLRNTLWWQVARERRLDPYILYAVALVESANASGRHRVAPWPWALNKSGKAIIPASKEEAHAILKNSLARGERQIDVGLMQVNVRWNGHRVGKPEELLDPATNLQIGADLLAEAIQSVPHDLVLGIGRYHSWQDVRAAMTYGRKVLAVADEIRTLL